MIRSILFLTSDGEDYLEDSVLHGLKTLLGGKVVDYPKKDCLYRGFDTSLVRGNGFSLYGLLPEDGANRHNITHRIRTGEFDAIIFGSIHRQTGFYHQYYPYLPEGRVAFLDGEDQPNLYPYLGKHLRKLSTWFMPWPNRRHPYFKREITERTKSGLLFSLGERLPLALLKEPRHVCQTAFAIPEEKIFHGEPHKNKEFTKHIVDLEVAAKVPGSYTSYAFSSEREYYEDIRSSRFGITTKRAGWDCLRHYEIAANGAVMCFRDLASKPERCAPHGLVAGINCLGYGDYEDLTRQIGAIDENRYRELRTASLEWAAVNTTRQRALQILQKLQIAIDE